MPNERKIELKNHNRMIKVLFVVYADFESIVKPINSREPSDEKSFTNHIKSMCPVDFLTRSFALMIRFGLKTQHTDRRAKKISVKSSLSCSKET